MNTNDVVDDDASRCCDYDVNTALPSVAKCTRWWFWGWCVCFLSWREMSYNWRHYDDVTNMSYIQCTHGVVRMQTFHTHLSAVARRLTLFWSTVFVTRTTFVAPAWKEVSAANFRVRMRATTFTRLTQFTHGVGHYFCMYYFVSFRFQMVTYSLNHSRLKPSICAQTFNLWTRTRNDTTSVNTLWKNRKHSACRGFFHPLA